MPNTTTPDPTATTAAPPPSSTSTSTPTANLGSHTVSSGGVGATTSHLPRGGATTVQIGLSTVDTLAHSSSIASVNPRDHERTYTYDKAEMHWKGKRYVLTIEIPLTKTFGEYDINELEVIAREYTGVFLEDLKQQLDAQADKCPIAPGQDFKVFFDDQGYVAFLPDKDFDPTNITRAELVKKCPNVAATGAQSVELSNILELRDPEKMSTRLAEPSFETLRDAASRTEKTSKVPFTPIGLANFTGVNCFLNAAFQQWITNPVIREELLKNPTYFQHGSNNPLFRAMKGYVAHSQSGSTAPFSLEPYASELGITTRRQDDVDVPLRAFTSQLNFKKIPNTSHLYSEITTTSNFSDTPISSTKDEEATLAHRTVNPESGRGLQQLIIEQRTSLVDDGSQLAGKDGKKHPLSSRDEQYKKRPDVLTVYVRRTKRTWNKPDASKANELIPKLKAQNLTDSQLNKLGIIDGDLVKFKETPPSDEDITKFATTILSQTNGWEDACALLGDAIMGSWLGPYNTVRDETEMDVEPTITLPKELCGSETQYELMSFACHETISGTASSPTAESGHYVTYVKDGNKYWKISDSSRTVSTQTDFETQAKKASSLVLNRKGITPTPAETEPTKPETKPNVELQKISLTPETTLIVEEGTLEKAGSNFVLVNPTDSTLRVVNPEIEKAEPKIKEQIRTAKTTKAGKQYFGKDKLEYSHGRGSMWDSLPDVEKTSPSTNTNQGVFHVVLPAYGPAPTQDLDKHREAIDGDIEDAVKAVLKRAAADGVEHVALPLILFPESGYNDPIRAINCMDRAIQKFVKENDKLVNPIKQVKIVLTPAQRKVVSPEATTASTPTPKAPTPPPALPQYKVGATTHKFTLDVSTNPAPTLAGTDPTVALKTDLEPAFGTLKTGDNVIFDFTQSGSTSVSKKQFNLGTYGLDASTGYQTAFEAFQAAFTQFSKSTTQTNITVTFKVPKGTSLTTPSSSDYPAVSATGSSTAATTTTAPLPPPPAPKTAQQTFLDGLQNRKTHSSNPEFSVPITRTQRTNIEVYTADPITPLRALKPKVTEASLATSFINLNQRDDLTEIVVDCRAGSSDSDGVIGLDCRHLDSNAQRIRNFIGYVILAYQISKPLKIIVDRGTTLLPKSKDLTTTFQRWNGFGRDYQPSDGRVPEILATA